MMHKFKSLPAHPSDWRLFFIHLNMNVDLLSCCIESWDKTILEDKLNLVTNLTYMTQQKWLINESELDDY
ncbi:MAG: hypothetical protein ACOCQ4_03375 [bacterium]